VSQGSVLIDGSENASVQFAPCCRPLPGDPILGYLGRGEGLIIHTGECGVGQRLLSKDRERFMGVEWAEEPTRTFESELVVTVNNGKGVLARVATAMTSAEADITRVNMGDETGGDTDIELRFVIAVRDTSHLDTVLRNLRRTPSVVQAHRVTSPAPTGRHH
jgi:guanosine-3',5'-bis(diphosphate) 3'-pyrophosphohydrolase